MNSAMQGEAIGPLLAELGAAGMADLIAMEATGISPMPRLLGHGVVAEAGPDGALCGWALLERAEGAPLSLAQIMALPGPALEVWKEALVEQAVALERCLDRAVPLACWEESYAGIRLRRIGELAADGRVAAVKIMNDI